MLATTLISLFALALSANAAPTTNGTDVTVGRRCTGTISSLADVAEAQKCTTININSFTVPAGKGLLINAATGATINMKGKITFAYKEWDGPLFKLSGKSVTFNGNGQTFDGLGAKYWDGQGLNGGKTKPAPMLQFTMSGTASKFTVLNAPTRAISLGNSGAALTLDGVTVDTSAGDAGELGHNTDCFDISATGGTTVKNSICKNQDDCLAINRGSDITFQNNQCSGGHGISVGSVSSSVALSNIKILNNKITASTNGLRIKTKASATGSTVNGITYTGNVATGITRFGVIIDQSYPTTLGTPGTGVKLSNVAFTAGNTIAVTSTGQRLNINCGSSSSCPGTMNLAGLTVTGGKAGKIVGAKTTGGSY